MSSKVSSNNRTGSFTYVVRTSILSLTFKFDLIMRSIWYSGKVRVIQRDNCRRSLKMEDRQSCLIARYHHCVPHTILHFLRRLDSLHSCLLLLALAYSVDSMFSGIQIMAVPIDANLANHALSEENTYRFHTFSADDAITLVQA